MERNEEYWRHWISHQVGPGMVCAERDGTMVAIMGVRVKRGQAAITDVAFDASLMQHKDAVTVFNRMARFGLYRAITIGGSVGDWGDSEDQSSWKRVASPEERENCSAIRSIVEKEVSRMRSGSDDSMGSACSSASSSEGPLSLSESHIVTCPAAPIEAALRPADVAALQGERSTANEWMFLSLDDSVSTDELCKTMNSKFVMWPSDAL